MFFQNFCEVSVLTAPSFWDVSWCSFFRFNLVSNSVFIFFAVCTAFSCSSVTNQLAKEQIKGRDLPLWADTMEKPPCLRENTDPAQSLRYTLSFAIHLRKITGKNQFANEVPSYTNWYSGGVTAFSRRYWETLWAGIATGYRLNCPGIESRCGRDFPHPSRPALGPIQPPAQWVPVLSRVEAAWAWC